MECYSAGNFSYTLCCCTFHFPHSVSCAWAGSMGKKSARRRSGSAKPQRDDGPEGPEWVEKNFEWFQELHRQKWAEAADEKDQVDQYTVSAEMEGK